MDGNKELIDYIIEHVNQRFAEVQSRLDKQDSKLDMLISFRYQIVGGAIAVSAIIGIIIQIVSILFSRS